MRPFMNSAVAFDGLPLKLQLYSQSTPTGLDCMGFRQRLSFPGRSTLMDTWFLCVTTTGFQFILLLSPCTILLVHCWPCHCPSGSPVKLPLILALLTLVTFYSYEDWGAGKWSDFFLSLLGSRVDANFSSISVRRLNQWRLCGDMTTLRCHSRHPPQRREVVDNYMHNFEEWPVQLRRNVRVYVGFFTWFFMISEFWAI